MGPVSIYFILPGAGKEIRPYARREGGNQARCKICCAFFVAGWAGGGGGGGLTKSLRVVEQLAQLNCSQDEKKRAHRNGAQQSLF